MRHYAMLRLLLAAFFLYFAWPLIPEASTRLELIFWAMWLGLLFLVVGGNFATLLQLTKPPAMEQDYLRSRESDND